jgi:RHS repeat-associated protein
MPLALVEIDLEFQSPPRFTFHQGPRCSARRSSRPYRTDNRNRLTKIEFLDDESNVTSTIEYVYDALNRRIARIYDSNGPAPGGVSSEFYAYDQTDVIFDMTTTTLPYNRYLWGPGEDQLLVQEYHGALWWALPDRLGSIWEYVPQEACSIMSYKYDAFGKFSGPSLTIGAGGGSGSPLTPSSFRYLYTCQENDSLAGLMYYDARWYDTATGKFMSQDPIGFNAGDENLYRYVGNDSILLTDSTGLLKRSLIKKNLEIWGKYEYNWHFTLDKAIPKENDFNTVVVLIQKVFYQRHRCVCKKNNITGEYINPDTKGYLNWHVSFISEYYEVIGFIESGETEIKFREHRGFKVNISQITYSPLRLADGDDSILNVKLPKGVTKDGEVDDHWSIPFTAEGVAGYDRWKGEVKAFKLSLNLLNLIKHWDPVNFGFSGKLRSGILVGIKIETDSSIEQDIFDKQFWNKKGKAIESETNKLTPHWLCNPPNVKD